MANGEFAGGAGELASEVAAAAESTAERIAAAADRPASIPGDWSPPAAIADKDGRPVSVYLWVCLALAVLIVLLAFFGRAKRAAAPESGT